MDSEPARVTPTEKTELYLTKKLNGIEQKIKKTKKKKKILQIIGGVVILGSMGASVLIASLAFPPIAVTSLSITSAILSGISMKFKLTGKGRNISKLMEKLNRLQIKLDYVISGNGDLTEAEYQSILRDFNYWIFGILISQTFHNFIKLKNIHNI